MAENTFKALVVEETPDKTFTRQVAEKPLEALPEGDVLIRVLYSSLNYKDALSATGNKGVTKHYPHTPGIDASGNVAESRSEKLKPGDAVIATGYDLGMNTAGGFGQYIRVPADWVVRLPAGLSLRESMAYGTAGFTAALSVYRLQEYGITPARGEVLVTGATGGVGSIAVALLAKEGYRVIAASGKPEYTHYLLELGAAEVIHRDEVNDTTGRPLLKARWAGAVDTVGGNMLATALRSIHYGGAVTCCGNVASPELALTVYPFILRGIGLLGIDSANCPSPVRLQLWQKLSAEWKLERLERLTSECSLYGLDREIERMLQGKQRGRVIVNLRD